MICIQILAHTNFRLYENVRLLKVQYMLFDQAVKNLLLCRY